LLLSGIISEVNAFKQMLVFWLIECNALAFVILDSFIAKLFKFMRLSQHLFFSTYSCFLFMAFIDLISFLKSSIFPWKGLLWAKKLFTSFWLRDVSYISLSREYLISKLWWISSSIPSFSSRVGSFKSQLVVYGWYTLNTSPYQGMHLHSWYGFKNHL
jgi:hypothetical protein